MDCNPVKGAFSGEIEVLIDKLTDQKVIHKKNSDLHFASRSGETERVERVLSTNPSLLFKVNSRGDTALHLAANGGHTSVVQALLDCRYIKSGVGRAKEMMLRKVNHNGDTALHEAVQYNRVDAVGILTQEDPYYEYPRNKAGETPLYLAAHRGYPDLVSLILQNCKSPTYGGPYGRTALHGAVISNSKECIEKLLGQPKYLLKEKDFYDWTALHLAAHLGYTDIVSQLLSVDETGRYLSNIDFGKALHMAASLGHIPIMKEIISRCPDSWDMVNKKGRNMLHIAAEHKQKEVIEYILDDFRFISSLINQRDKDGNTPLHLLASAKCFVPKLIRHSMADKNAINNQELTPLNIAVVESDVAKELKRVGAMSNCQHFKKHDEAEIARINKMGETHMIVAVLIATVTFTAGFTLPGGFNGNEGPNQGFAILARTAAFKAFMITDTIALLYSAVALTVYFRAPITDDNPDELANSYAFAASLTVDAIRAMMVAFVTGTYTVLAHSPAIAIATCVCGCSFFPIHYWVLRDYFHKIFLQIVLKLLAPLLKVLKKCWPRRMCFRNKQVMG